VKTVLLVWLGGLAVLLVLLVVVAAATLLIEQARLKQCIRERIERSYPRGRPFLLPLTPSCYTDNAEVGGEQG